MVSNGPRGVNTPVTRSIRSISSCRPTEFPLEPYKRPGARLRKSVFINESVVGKSSRIAVRIVRRTKLSIDGARISAGDAVAVTKPRPSNGITDRDICCGRRERETIHPNRNLKDLARTRWHAAHRRPAVFINNMDLVDRRLFQLCRGDMFVTRSSLRRKHQRKRRCQRKSDSYCCV